MRAANDDLSSSSNTQTQYNLISITLTSSTFRYFYPTEQQCYFPEHSTRMCQLESQKGPFLGLSFLLYEIRRVVLGQVIAA